MEGSARELRKFSPRARLFPCILTAVLLLLTSCVKSPVLAPPDRIRSLEGYGSASLRGETGFSKAKFSFVFEWPGRGKIEALDVLGRTMYFILFGDGSSYLVVPSKRIFAEAGAGTMMNRMFGLDFSPEEVICLMSGRWGNGNTGGGTGLQAAWSLDRDDKGRVQAGTKGEFRFEVIEFHKGIAVPRSVSFRRPPNEGRIKITALWFNRPIRPKVFDAEFLKGYQPKTWAEMEILLKNED